MATDDRTPTQLASVSQLGLRSSNQDRVLARHSIAGTIIAVADGMGGMEAGDQAAEASVRLLERWFQTGVAFTHDAFLSAVQGANRAVHQSAVDSGLAGRTGTTLVACVIQGTRYLVANAGDSRCYYINNHSARCLTRDHSRVQALVNQGAMSEETARKSPFRNELTNSLGEPHEIRVDVTPREPFYGVIDEDCALLVCSDGLHAWVTDEEMFDALLAAPSLEQGCAALIELALRNGSTDNMTVAAVECGRLARKGESSVRRNPWGGGSGNLCELVRGVWRWSLCSRRRMCSGQRRAAPCCWAG